MKLDKNILIILGGAVAGALMLFIGFLLIRGIIQFGRTGEALEKSVDSLSSYYSKNPFPSTKNISREKKNADILNEWYGKLSKELKKGEINPDPTKRPSKFMNLFSRKSKELRHMADTNGCFLSPAFAFGFNRYSTGIPPAPDDVPRLIQQLIIIENLFTIFCEERAKEIIIIKRDEFESSSAPAARAGVRRSGRRSRRGSRGGRGASATAQAADVNAGVMGEDDLFARLHFTFEIKVKEGPLWNILNRLARHEMFVVVTSLELEREGATVLMAEHKSKRKRAILEEGPGDETQKHEIPARLERLLCGLELEKPMKVTLEMDVYRFRGE